MTRQNGPYFDENYLRQGSPTNSTFAATAPATIATPTTVATLPYVVAS